MTGDIAARMTPYISYFFFGQLVVTGLAILVAVLLVIRRISRRDPIAQMEPDKERIAAEIHQEILRLRALRDRLVPGFAGEPMEAIPATAISPGAPVVASTPAEPTLGPVPVSPASGLSAADIEAAEKRGEGRSEVKFQAQIADLEAKLAAALAASPAPAGASGGANPEEIEKHRKAAAEAQTQAQALSEKVGALEKVLAEYQIFEEDFALVKKYKEENDRLRQQIEVGGGAAPSPKVTEDDIASLFGDFGAEMLAEPTLSAVPAPQPVAAPEPTPMPMPEPEPAAKDLFAELEATLQAQAPAAPEEAEVDPDLAKLFESVAEETPAPAQPPEPAVAAAPAPAAMPVSAPPIAVNEDTAEALAESTGTDDEMMAEFEKLLGESSKG